MPYVSYGITDTVSVSADLGWGNFRTADSFPETRLVFVPQANQAKPGGKLSPTLPGALGGAFGISPLPPPSPPFQFVQVPVRLERRGVGAQDPVFGVTWRAVDERHALVNLDLQASYAPDIFQARGASALDTGSLATGGQRGTVEAAISRELQRLTIRAYGVFGYDGRRNTSEIGYVSRAGAHPDYTAGVQTQTRLLPFLALNAGASVSRAAQFDEVDISTFQGTTYRSSETIRPATVIAPYAGLVFPLVGRRAVGELLYQHEFVTEEEVIEAPGDGRFYNQQTNLFTASIRFVLG